MKKFRKVMAAVLVMGMLLTTSCGQTKERFMFGTGGTAGTYYSYGGVLSQYMKNYAGIKVTAVSTGASKVNLQSIQDGDFQLGFTQSDVMTYAWEGSRRRMAAKQATTLFSIIFFLFIIFLISKSYFFVNIL